MALSQSAVKVQGKIEPVLVIGGGPVGLALAGDLGWRGISCALIEQSDGSIYQPRMDLVGVRTMEFCRRWGLVPAVEASPYPRDYAQDNIYLTSLTGYELGRERFPGIGQAPPPKESPQRRERCPQNMFDPILRAFAASQKTVEMRYRTRLISFSQTADHVTAVVENAETGAREDIVARYIVGCDGARSLVRETLGIAMHGTPVLTYTTNVIFRCPNLLSLHDKGKAYRHIFIGPEGTWSTIVAINGRDQWRFSIIGGSDQREYTTDEIKAAIRRAVGRDFEFEILSVVPWVRRELVADHYRNNRGFIAGDAAHVMSPTGGFGMNTGIQDAVDLSWKLAAVLEGWGGNRPAQFLRRRAAADRHPQCRRGERQSSPHALGSPSPGPSGRHAAGRRDARESGAGIQRDHAPRMVHARRPSRLPLRGFAGLLPGRLGRSRRRSAKLCADGAPRAPRPARFSGGRALNSRSVRPRFYAAGLRRERRGGRTAPRSRQGAQCADELCRDCRARHRRPLSVQIRTGAPGWPCRLAGRPHAGRCAKPRRRRARRCRRLEAAMPKGAGASGKISG